jgi:hypothetical protein
MASGSYTYDIRGDEMTSTGGVHPITGEGSLVVDPPSSASQRMVLHDPASITETTLRYQSDGVYLTALRITTAVFTKEFRPDAPVALFKIPASAGAQWSWTARSTDGRATLAATFTVARGETMSVGAQSAPSWVLGITMKLSGDVEALMTQTVWRSQDGRQVYRNRSTAEGAYLGIAFKWDVQSLLRSTSPD